MILGIHHEKTWNNLANIIRWVDGDTVDVLVDAGYDVLVRIRVRLQDINTPERGKPNFKEATAFAESLAPVGSTIILKTKKYERTFNRYVGEIIVPDGEEHVSVNDALVASGLAEYDPH